MFVIIAEKACQREIL